MEKVFRLFDDIPKRKRDVFYLLAITIGLQILDYLTTKWAVYLNGGGAVEANPFVRYLIPGGGLEWLLIIKIGLPFLIIFSHWKNFRKFDLWVVGFLIFGFLFIFLNNLTSIFKIMVSQRLVTYQPMTEADVLDTAYRALFNYGGLAIMFFLIGLYVWRRYQRSFCFGPAIICAIIVFYSVINIIGTL